MLSWETETKDVKDDVVSPIPTTSSMMAEPQRQNSNATQADEEISLNSEHIEINEAYECLVSFSYIFSQIDGYRTCDLPREYVLNMLFNFLFFINR